MDDLHARRWESVEEGAELLREGRAEEGTKALLRVVEREPENEYAHFFLGNAFYDQEQFSRALKCYVRALDLAPRYLGAMVAAGHALRMMGRLDQAMRMAKQALILQKEDSDALFLLGTLHFQRGDTAEAIRTLEQFLESQPELEAATDARGMLEVLRDKVVPVNGEE